MEKVRARQLMKKVVIFCGSYPQITNALFIATRNYQDCAVTIVIPGIHNLFRFFQVINEKTFQNRLNLVFFKLYLTGKTETMGMVKRVFHTLLDIVKQRLYLKEIFNRYFAELKGAEIYFSTRYFCPYTIYLLKRLCQENTLIFICDPSMDGMKVEKFTPASIIDWAKFIILKLVYGLDITMGKLPYRNFPCMSDKFFSSQVDKAFSQEERDEMLRGFDLSPFKVFDVGDYDVIFFGHEMILPQVPQSTLRKELAEVFSILRKRFSENRVAYKYHPRQEGGEYSVEIGDRLPNFIPAEFLYSDSVKMYISPYSISIANVEKGLPVSLVDLISFKSEETRRQLKEALIKRSRSEILFPKSLQEFEDIVKGLKG